VLPDRRSLALHAGIGLVSGQAPIASVRSLVRQSECCGLPHTIDPDRIGEAGFAESIEFRRPEHPHQTV